MGAAEPEYATTKNVGSGAVGVRSCQPERVTRSCRDYDRDMRRVADIGLIAGFLFVDFLFFHDLLKPGEVTTLPQYMTGFLSIVVFVICGQSLLRPQR